MDLTGYEAPTHPESLGHRETQFLNDYLSKEKTQIQTKDTPVLKRLSTYLKRTEKSCTIPTFLR
jgi:predicted secreted protein